MKIPFLPGAVAASMILSLAAALAPAAVATPGDRAPRANLKVVVVAPKGLPTAVQVRTGKKRQVLATTRARTTHRLRVRPGKTRIFTDPVTWRGKTYRAVARQTVTVGRKTSTKVVVKYVRVKAATDVAVRAVSPKSVTVSWKGRTPKGTSYVVRRTAGTTAARTPKQGTGVKVNTKRRTATSARLAAGDVYTFTVFTVKRQQAVVKGKKRIRKQVVAAQSVSATAFDSKSPQGGYIAPGTSRIYTDAGKAPKAWPLNGRVAVKVSGTIPQIGAGYVLPPTPTIPYGMVGVVDEIAPDGSHALLRHAAVDEVFDAVVGSGSLDSGPYTPGITNAPAEPLAPLPSTRPGVATTTPSTSDGSALAKCLGGSSDLQAFSIKPTFTPSGTFKHGFTKSKILGLEFTSGAYVNLGASITVEAPMTVKATRSFRCAADFESLVKPFNAGPVPMVLVISPVAEVYAEGEVDMSNVGYGGKVGQTLNASFSLPANANITGDPTLEMYPLTPQVNSGNFKAGVAIGADFNIGPGTGSEDVGVVVGLEAQLRLLDATIGPKFPANDKRHLKCAELSAKGSITVGLAATAWLKGWDATKAVRLDPLEKQYGSPLYLPSGCQNLQEPGDDVYGEDVEVIDDHVDGGDEQYGRDDAFTPGHDAWILSTGLMSAIRSGNPEEPLDPEDPQDPEEPMPMSTSVGGQALASTDLGYEGNERLSELAGLPTFDAVSFHATVVPKRSTLHVRYLFASEEYPEYVGSPYNDVMAVFINGVNCAVVDGEPVAVNTINPDKHADKYIENMSNEIAMDGWTVPMECSVPVTPGVPVTIELAVADTSDGILDSAVALIDKGIWSS